MACRKVMSSVVSVIQYVQGGGPHMITADQFKLVKLAPPNLPCPQNPFKPIHLGPSYLPPPRDLLASG